MDKRKQSAGKGVIFYDLIKSQRDLKRPAGQRYRAKYNKLCTDAHRAYGHNTEA